MDKIKIGFALCGSYCTYDKILNELKELVKKYNITPIMSENSALTNTRFGRAEDFIAQLELICENKIIKTIEGAEPIGPKRLFDVLVIAPCTGNTIGKLAAGIADTAVTMAAKAHLRNERPLVIAISTNDALAGSAKNIGDLLNRKNIYFVPMRQDDPDKKPRSIVADMTKIEDTIEAAIMGKQVQPIIK